MTAEPNTFFVHLTDVGEAEDLKTAAVGEYRPVPSFEGVQTACLAQDLRTRTQVQMIGIP